MHSTVIPWGWFLFVSLFKNSKPGNKPYNNCLFRALPSNIDFRHVLPSQARAILWRQSIFSGNALINSYYRVSTDWQKQFNIVLLTLFNKNAAEKCKHWLVPFFPLRTFLSTAMVFVCKQWKTLTFFSLNLTTGCTGKYSPSSRSSKPMKSCHYLYSQFHNG